MLKSLRISSGVLPLIMFATVLQPTSLQPTNVNVTSKSDANKYTQKRFDIEVVCSENDLEKHLLIDSDEFLVPLAYIRCSFACLVLILVSVS